MKGKLIVIEGLDGSGKATQTALLAESLARSGIAVHTLSFPDYKSRSSALIQMYLGGEFGSRPEDVGAYTASLFYTVDRAASFLSDWKKGYEQGELFLADRYTTSNILHQMPKLPRKEWQRYIAWLTELEYEKVALPAPDRVIYLDVPPCVSKQLLLQRYEGREDRKDLHERDEKYLGGCRKAAEFAAANLGWKVLSCCKESDGGFLMRSPEEIHGMVLDQLSDLIELYQK